MIAIGQAAEMILHRRVKILAAALLLASASGAVAQEDFANLDVLAPTTAARIGENIQLSVIGVRSDGTEVDVTAGQTGTAYNVAYPFPHAVSRRCLRGRSRSICAVSLGKSTDQR